MHDGPKRRELSERIHMRTLSEQSGFVADTILQRQDQQELFPPAESDTAVDNQKVDENSSALSAKARRKNKLRPNDQPPISPDMSGDTADKAGLQAGMNEEKALHKEEADLGKRADRLQKAVDESAALVATLRADLDCEKTLHSEARRIAAEKEKQLAGRIKELETESRSLSGKLASALQVTEELRQKDEALQQGGRKREADAAQRFDQLQRSVDSRVADVTKFKAELDRERALLAETRRLASEKEQQLMGRMKDLEAKAREATARMTESAQLAEERRRRYEAVQQEARQKENETALRVEQLQKSADNAGKRMREMQQKLEEDQSLHAQTLREARRKEQELADRSARMEAEAGAAASLIAQLRMEAEKQKRQDQTHVDHGKQRETQISQRLAQVQNDHEQALIALDQARKKLAERKPAQAVDLTGSDREKRLTAALSLLEKQAAESAASLARTKIEAEKWKQEFAKVKETLEAREGNVDGSIEDLRKTAGDAVLAAETAKKASDEQSRISRSLSEEVASLKGRNTSLQGELRGATEALQASQKELSISRRLLDDAGRALSEERKRHESDVQRLSEDRVRLERESGRFGGGILAADQVGAKSRGLDKIAVTGIVAFVAGVGVYALVAGCRTTDSIHKRATSTELPAKTSPLPTRPVSGRPSVPSAVRTEPAAGTAGQVIRPAAPMKWPEIAIDGLKVTKTEQAMTIVFQYGVFSGLTVMKDKARSDLRILAGKVKAHVAGFTLVVTGTTDSVPPSSTVPFASNYELGMARAKTVVSFLEKECQLPASFLMPASAGGAMPPFPDSDPEAKLKNRTVVLKLVRAAGAADVRANRR